MKMFSPGGTRFKGTLILCSSTSHDHIPVLALRLDTGIRCSLPVARESRSLRFVSSPNGTSFANSAMDGLVPCGSPLFQNGITLSQRFPLCVF